MEIALAKSKNYLPRGLTCKFLMFGNLNCNLVFCLKE